MSGPLNADQPIKDPEDDLLGVAPFAHALAESILKMTTAFGFKHSVGSLAATPSSLATNGSAT
jgi:predicted KAP-like P-loop ATPase